MADKTAKQPEKAKAPETITLLKSAKIKCIHVVNGETREYGVSLVARTYTIVDNMDLEIDPVRNLIRRDKLEAIADQLTIKTK